MLSARGTAVPSALCGSRMRSHVIRIFQQGRTFKIYAFLGLSTAKLRTHGWQFWFTKSQGVGRSLEWWVFMRYPLKIKDLQLQLAMCSKNQDGGFGFHAIRKSTWLCYWNKQILSLRIALPKYHKVIHQKCKIWSIINLKSVFFQLMLSENCSLSQKFWKLKNLLQQLYKQKFTLSLVI